MPLQGAIRLLYSLEEVKAKARSLIVVHAYTGRDQTSSFASPGKTQHRQNGRHGQLSTKREKSSTIKGRSVDIITPTYRTLVEQTKWVA